ncbi:EP300-interacting inhibitor of differentiation 1 [Fukomys damarensis]|uniref:EP300-interacting inhibitor of differentiation 1 n=1 Tax=Fukomys damarensis TaxID=885580 RepID=A0A091CQ48_FUKDA|nr:EP300-interacting inhibitor of differentiation 1 [Fukomys damarensis]
MAEMAELCELYEECNDLQMDVMPGEGDLPQMEATVMCKTHLVRGSTPTCSNRRHENPLPHMTDRHPHWLHLRPTQVPRHATPQTLDDKGIHQGYTGFAKRSERVYNNTVQFLPSL